MTKNQAKYKKEPLSNFPQIIAERFPFLTAESPLSISLEYILKNFSFSDNWGKEDLLTHISSYFDDLIKFNIIKSWKTEDKNGLRFSIFVTPNFVFEIKETNLSKRKEINKIVLDTSAILVLLAMGEGYEAIAENLENSVVSSVNFSEVITVLVRKGLKYEEVAQSLKDTFPQIEEFNDEQAIIAASLDEVTRKHELSLGDRSCLALAKHQKLPVLTADKAWKDLDLGVEVHLIVTR